jgi:hypothetical protein
MLFQKTALIEGLARSTICMPMATPTVKIEVVMQGCTMGLRPMALKEGGAVV